jgi:hypothetical protein
LSAATCRRFIYDRLVDHHVFDKSRTNKSGDKSPHSKRYASFSRMGPRMMGEKKFFFY